MTYPLPDTYVRKVELPHSTLILREDGIVEIRCADNFTYDIKEIMENHSVLKEMAGNDKVRVLNFTGRYTMITNEARAYVAQGNHAGYVAAEAVLIYSLAQRMYAQFFLKMRKPIVPANYFAYKDKEIAEKWLKGVHQSTVSSGQFSVNS